MVIPRKRPLGEEDEGTSDDEEWKVGYAEDVDERRAELLRRLDFKSSGAAQLVNPWAVHGGVGLPRGAPPGGGLLDVDVDVDVNVDLQVLGVEPGVGEGAPPAGGAGHYPPSAHRVAVASAGGGVARGGLPAGGCGTQVHKQQQGWQLSVGGPVAAAATATAAAVTAAAQVDQLLRDLQRSATAGDEDGGGDGRGGDGAGCDVATADGGMLAAAADVAPTLSEPKPGRPASPSAITAEAAAASPLAALLGIPGRCGSSGAAGRGGGGGVLGATTRGSGRPPLSPLRSRAVGLGVGLPRQAGSAVGAGVGSLLPTAKAAAAASGVGSSKKGKKGKFVIRESPGAPAAVPRPPLLLSQQQQQQQLYHPHHSRQQQANHQEAEAAGGVVAPGGGEARPEAAPQQQQLGVASAAPTPVRPRGGAVGGLAALLEGGPLPLQPSSSAKPLPAAAAGCTLAGASRSLRRISAPAPLAGAYTPRAAPPLVATTAAGATPAPIGVQPGHLGQGAGGCTPVAAAAAAAVLGGDTPQRGPVFGTPEPVGAASTGSGAGLSADGPASHHRHHHPHHHNRHQQRQQQQAAVSATTPTVATPTPRRQQLGSTPGLLRELLLPPPQLSTSGPASGSAQAGLRAAAARTATTTFPGPRPGPAQAAGAGRPPHGGGGGAAAAAGVAGLSLWGPHPEDQPPHQPDGPACMVSTPHPHPLSQQHHYEHPLSQRADPGADPGAGPGADPGADPGHQDRHPQRHPHPQHQQHPQQRVNPLELMGRQADRRREFLQGLGTPVPPPPLTGLAPGRRGSGGGGRAGGAAAGLQGRLQAVLANLKAAFDREVEATTSGRPLPPPPLGSLLVQVHSRTREAHLTKASCTVRQVYGSAEAGGGDRSSQAAPPATVPTAAAAAPPRVGQSLHVFLDSKRGDWGIEPGDQLLVLPPWKVLLVQPHGSCEQQAGGPGQTGFGAAAKAGAVHGDGGTGHLEGGGGAARERGRAGEGADAAAEGGAGLRGLGGPAGSAPGREIVILAHLTRR